MEHSNERSIKNRSLFNMYTTPYKTVNQHEITTDILIPKNIQPGNHPVFVKIHGGGLITGSSSYIGFIAAWIWEVAHLHSAIVVMPNYRLIPESKGVDILEDIADFWKWVDKDLPAFVSQLEGGGGIEVDVSKIWVHGDSAGAYLGIQSGLTLPKDTLRVISAAYPFLDFEDPWYTQAFNKPFFGGPQLPASIVDEHLAAMRPGEVISAVDPPARIDLTIAVGQNGRRDQVMGTEPSLYPLKTIETAKSFPPLFIFHGWDDKVVPCADSLKFAEKLKRFFPDNKVVMKIEPGNHGFDTSAELSDPWLKEGLELVTTEWLK